ncbi:hypothetical protein PHSY_003383 [Pseudozyma hubeiensis SY62]|uniref:Uncharacterized protein n=1 Tax=Pseudozyma hubeiensis (strain SY62) TaxID=1305764 RepID=R9P388_PSEHS|nr:hypothetical protein PHSY_003383 [Pseudozyma hubeiensis SY62]GAC95806.1 hypothetical protein PHSY_003383 [Pseudozyma hubeiensis SY62]
MKREEERERETHKERESRSVRLFHTVTQRQRRTRRKRRFEMQVQLDARTKTASLLTQEHGCSKSFPLGSRLSHVDISSTGISLLSSTILAELSRVDFCFRSEKICSPRYFSVASTLHRLHHLHHHLHQQRRHHHRLLTSIDLLRFIVHILSPGTGALSRHLALDIQLRQRPFLEISSSSDPLAARERQLKSCRHPDLIALTTPMITL